MKNTEKRACIINVINNDKFRESYFVKIERQKLFIKGNKNKMFGTVKENRTCY